MPCYHPLRGYRSKTANSSGKRSIVFTPHQGYIDQQVELPCGQCIGCRLERSRQWAIRCHHEASLHEQNSFITLTYAPEHLPKDKSLHVEDFQKFMKRLRKRFSHKKIRFFHCGEYGEKFGRPHYHACLFGFDFHDKILWKETHSKDKLYVSQILEELWPFGFSTIGDVTFESAAYVARYITKKVTGSKALEHYNTINFATGEITDERRPEYVTMSRRPGIGKNWYEKYKNDVYPHDYVVMRSKQIKPPKFYDNQYELDNPADFARLKHQRKTQAMECTDNTPDRRLTKETVKHEKFKLLKRNYENDV